MAICPMCTKLGGRFPPAACAPRHDAALRVHDQLQEAVFGRRDLTTRATSSNLARSDQRVAVTLAHLLLGHADAAKLRDRIDAGRCQVALSAPNRAPRRGTLRADPAPSTVDANAGGPITSTRRRRKCAARLVRRFLSTSTKPREVTLTPAASRPSAATGAHAAERTKTAFSLAMTSPPTSRVFGPSTSRRN